MMNQQEKKNMVTWGLIGAGVFMLIYYVAVNHFPDLLSAGMRKSGPEAIPLPPPSQPIETTISTNLPN